MNVLVAADIFGATPQLRALLADIPAETSVVSPYGDHEFDFTGEDHAYACFQSHGGIAAYATRLADAIMTNTPAALIGFSAGATAAWIALAQPGACTAPALLYYGSRIRDYLDLRPHGPVRLLFAQHEKATDADALVRTLCSDGVDARVVPGTTHGFMNARSRAYDAAATREQLEIITAWLDGVRRAPRK